MSGSRIGQRTSSSSTFHTGPAAPTNAWKNVSGSTGPYSVQNQEAADHTSIAVARSHQNKAYG